MSQVRASMSRQNASGRRRVLVMVDASPEIAALEKEVNHWWAIL